MNPALVDRLPSCCPTRCANSGSSREPGAAPYHHSFFMPGRRSYRPIVPQLFAGTGAELIATGHKQFPWTMGLLPSNVGEGAIYGRQIAANTSTAAITPTMVRDRTAIA